MQCLPKVVNFIDGVSIWYNSNCSVKMTFLVSLDFQIETGIIYLFQGVAQVKYLIVYSDHLKLLKQNFP